MDNKGKQYIAIDLKSFYASCECVNRHLDPLKNHLVVADPTRTEKTICLAVTPSLKKYGIPGRARLYEVVQKVKEINRERLRHTTHGRFIGESHNDDELKNNPDLALSFIVAPPQMAFYMKKSTEIYHIYLQYVSKEDIHVYSVDEVFIDVTPYLHTYACTAHELCIKMIRSVLKQTGITATAGVGTNLYLAKIAMDIVAKKMEADKDGVRIAELDERSYREKLWDHTPITDFWRVGKGIANRLMKHGLYTMGDIALCACGKLKPHLSEETLYREFGVGAELLIDHAFGYEPCEIKDIKGYKPQSQSVSTGQVLSLPYKKDMAELIVREMTELLVLDLVEKKLVTNQMVLTIGFDNVEGYTGETQTDPYGRTIPKMAHGSIKLPEYTSSTREIVEATLSLFRRIMPEELPMRRVYVVANNVLLEDDERTKNKAGYEQLDLFTDYSKKEQQDKQKEEKKKKEKKIQNAMLSIQHQYGKNAILKGMNLQEGAKTIERNGQVGGHRAGSEERVEWTSDIQKS